jgi:hypothetical protein
MVRRKTLKVIRLEETSQTPFVTGYKLSGDNLNNVSDASRYFRNKKQEYLKDKINEPATNSMSYNIRGLYKGITESKKCYQHRNNAAKDENGDLLAGSHSILNMR